MWYAELIKNIETGLLTGLCLFILLIIIWREIAYRKVKILSGIRKEELLNQICNPLGYDYIQKQDIFVTRLDAWQANFGYEALYDEMAVTVNMVFDCYPIYFNYHGRTWMIEFWKGQYGIAVGGEIGLYYTDHIVDPHEYAKTHFEAVTLGEVLGFGVYLQADGKDLLYYRKLHWWLGAFRVGRVIRPDRIHAVYRIRFFDPKMQEAFLKGAVQSGYPMELIQEQSCCLIRISHSTETYMKQTWYRRFRAGAAKARNCLLNALYLFYTAPFHSSEDRLLFLYYQLPFIVRRMFRLRAYRKRFGRRKHELS